MSYIKFALQEKKLFQLLFMCEQKETKDIQNVLEAINENYEIILKSVQEPYGLTRERDLKLYQNLWIYTHGIAVLCATKVCRFSEEEINERLTEVFIGLFKEDKAGGVKALVLSAAKFTKQLDAGRAAVFER